MAYRESGDYRRNRDRDEEFRGSEFRGGAEERGGRGQQSGGSFSREYEESGREMQFGREHEQSGRGQDWESGSPGFGSRGYGLSQRWEPQGTRGGYSGESQGYGSPGYGTPMHETYGPQQQRYGSGGQESQGYGSQGYGYPSGSQYGRGRYGDRFGRSPEGIDRSRDYPTGQSYGTRYGQEFGGGTSQYGERSRSFPGTQGFGQTFGEPGYTEGQFGTSGRTRGRYTGRGPKGYIRSDDRIKEDVSDRLEQHGEIDAWDIVVMVQNGEVNLEGIVPDRRTKRLAEDVAEESPGVKQVNNRLRVQGQSASEQASVTSGSTIGSTESERPSRTGATPKSSSR